MHPELNITSKSTESCMTREYNVTQSLHVLHCGSVQCRLLAAHPLGPDQPLLSLLNFTHELFFLTIVLHYTRCCRFSIGKTGRSKYILLSSNSNHDRITWMVVVVLHVLALKSFNPRQKTAILTNYLIGIRKLNIIKKWLQIQLVDESHIINTNTNCSIKKAYQQTYIIK